MILLPSFSPFSETKLPDYDSKLNFLPANCAAVTVSRVFAFFLRCVLRLSSGSYNSDT